MLLALWIVPELRDAEDIYKAPQTPPEALHEGLVERCHSRVSGNDQGLPLRLSWQQEQQASATWTIIKLKQSKILNSYLLKVFSAAL